MKKILLVLTVLALTAPTWAAVSVTCTADGNDVTVSYDCDGDANDIRAFGIQVSVDNGGVISGIDVNDADYYIFPGSIDIDGEGVVQNYGSAVVDQTSSSFILEMGSLYAPEDGNHPTVPPQSGTLCTFTVAVPATGCTVSLATDTSRGGVVMEDGNSYATLSGVVMPYGECYPAGMADWDEWDAVGRPLCWCNPRQCYGDADGIEHSDKSKPFDFWVGIPDLQVLSLGWQKPDEDPNYSAFICADFNHTVETDKSIPYDFRVGMPDLQILSAYWYGPNDGKPAPGTDCITP